MDFSKPIGQFTDDLLKLLIHRSHDGNALISPISLSIGMSMLLAGAKNNSHSQIKMALKLPPKTNIDQVHNYYNKLLQNYSTTPQERTLKTEQIYIRNLALVSQMCQMVKGYNEKLRDVYKAEVDSVDFYKSGSGIVKRVNQWVSNSTNNLIQNILSEPPAGNTKLMLLNCIYFKGVWMEEFVDVGPRDFHQSLTRTKSAPFMRSSNKFKYLKVPFNSTNELVEIVEVPYKGKTSMVLIRPPESASANDIIAENSISELLHRFDKKGRNEKMVLLMPKFTFKCNMEMSDIFEKMGASDIFNSALADLSGIANFADDPLFVSNITHSTVIEVDEKGTKAAAVTSIGFTKSLGHRPAKFLVLDVPFIFVIFDTNRKLPLFVGKLQDPIC